MPIHDIRINKAKLLVAKRLGKRTDDGKTEFLVEPDSRQIRTHDIVELQGQETFAPSLRDAVIDQGAANAFALSGWSDKVSCAGYMGTKVWIVGPNLVHAHYVTVDYGNISGVRPEPVSTECIAVQGVGEGQRIAGGYHRLKNIPHGRKIRLSRSCDLHGNSGKTSDA